MLHQGHLDNEDCTGCQSLVLVDQWFRHDSEGRIARLPVSKQEVARTRSTTYAKEYPLDR